MISAISRLIVDTVRAGHRQRAWLSGVALVLVLVVATGYLLVGALRLNPMQSMYHVRIQLPESGGLLANQDVSLRGVQVGRIESLTLTTDGVDAVAAIKSDVKIPASSPVRVSGLSAAGEQYIDFVPTTSAGPFLGEGSVIGTGNTTTPIPLSRLLADADGLLAQTDPRKLELVKRELSLTDAGPRKLTDTVDGGIFLLSTLDSVLPETVSLVRNSRIVLTTAADVNAGLAATTDNLGHLLTGVAAMDGGYRRLLDQTPGLLSTLDTLYDDNSDTMVGLLANLATTAQLLYVRVPALNALFPNYRGSVLDSAMSIMHDHGLWAAADIYPKYTCDYGTPRRVPSAADYPEPFRYTYCRDDDPSVLIRGAKNAPRPAGDDTAGPPPGADLSATTNHTPTGRYTVPTPYGGPTLPIEPPH
ncbi:MlaD family protein [Mycobacterium sp. pUA109]|uniref:MlaD family protein n=1 Tax=Mycobacterium sp. pUA109 TaxID=3238982 RepID=UPI00351B40AA